MSAPVHLLDPERGPDSFTLERERQVIDLCRRVRDLAVAHHIDDRRSQRLAAVVFDAAQRLQAAGAGAVGTVDVAPDGGLQVALTVRDPEALTSLTLPGLPARPTNPSGLPDHTGTAEIDSPHVAIALDPSGSARLLLQMAPLPHAVAAAVAPPAALLDSRMLFDAGGLARDFGVAVVAGREAVPGRPDLPPDLAAVHAELTRRTEDLRLAEQRLGLLLDSVRDYAILLLTIDGTISSANVGAERLFDCPAGEMAGRGFEQFYQPADREAGLPARHLVEAGRGGGFEAVGLRLTRGPLAFDAHIVLAPLRDDVEVLRGFSLVVRDITERKRLEDDLRRRAEDLAAANRAKEDFLATLSHELRTPLNAMLGWTRLLRMGKLDATGVERALVTIERNAHLQEQLIADILDVSRIVTGKLRLTLRPTDLAPVVDAALDAVRPAADAKGVQLLARLQTPGGVLGDPDRLQQVVWNLLANAIKFTPAGGTVTAALEEAEGGALVTVTDSGEGIAADLLPYIFDRFRQGDASSTRPHGGIGLGLSIVRHIVELHGGQVIATSAGRGRGAAFSVRLPLRHAPRPAPGSDRPR